MKKKLCLFGVTPLSYSGGYEKFMIELAGYINSSHGKEFDVEILTFNSKLFVFIKKIVGLITLSYKKEILDSNKSSSVELANVRYAQINSFKDYLKLSKFDVIYSKNEILEGLTLFFLPNKPKIISGVHTVHKYFVADSLKSKIHNIIHGSFVYNLLWYYADAFHVINKMTQIELSHQFKNKKIFLAYNKLPNFKFENIERGKGCITISWVGRMTEQKGVKDLVEIINNATKENIMWNIIGDGPDASYLKHLNDPKNVKIFGHLSSDEVNRELLRSDYLITTSKWEGFPYNVLEAIITGNKVIGYNIFGVNDIVDEKVGFLFENKKDIINFINRNDIKVDWDRAYLSNYIKNKFSETNTIGVLLENIRLI